jgi:hypothetical protein
MLSQSHPPSAQPRRSTTHPDEAPSLPEYVAPEAPLTAEAQRHLAALISNHHHRNLITHLKHAAEKLTHSGGEVNERLADARGRYEKSKYQRRQREGIDEENEDDEDDEEYQRLAEEETRVNAITARMEEKARLMVDSEAKLQGLTDAVRELERQEGESITAALGSRQTRAGQRNRRRGNDEDEDGDGEDENDADYEDAQEREAQERNARNPPSRRLDDKLAEGSEKWNEMSLTERCVASVVPIWGVWRLTFTILDMLAITTTSGSIAWCTTPNSPATTCPHSPTLLHGSSIWRIPVPALVHQHAPATNGVAPPLPTTTISPLNASVSLSSAH